MKEEIKGGVKMNKKKYIWLFSILFVGIATAAWLFSISGTFNMIVESIPGYASIDLGEIELNVNTTGDEGTTMQTMSFLVNKDMDLSVEIIEIYQDLSAGLCLDGVSDCNTSYHIDIGNGIYSEIHNGDNVSLVAESYLRTLNATMTCVAYSCPQSRSIEINLLEII